MNKTKQVTSAEWVQNAAELMTKYDRIEIVQNRYDGKVVAIYSRPEAPEFMCCETNRAEIARLKTAIARLKTALHRIASDAKTGHPMDNESRLRRIAGVIRRTLGARLEK